MLPDSGDSTSPFLESDEAIGFWSEHSDRCGLDSWCAALNFGPSQRICLGRWGAKGSSDKYVRTALRIIETLQVVAARAARATHRGGPDYFGEEQTLYGLKVKLKEKDFDRDSISSQIRALTSADVELDVPENFPDDSDDPDNSEGDEPAAQSSSSRAGGTASTPRPAALEPSMIERLQESSSILLSTTASGRLPSPAEEPGEGETQNENFIADFGEEDLVMKKNWSQGRTRAW